MPEEAEEEDATTASEEMGCAAEKSSAFDVVSENIIVVNLVLEQKRISRLFSDHIYVHLFLRHLEQDT